MKGIIQSTLYILILVGIIGVTPSNAQESIARKWNEVLLQAIRNDFARPTVHARNLFHISAAMYDAWAVYDDKASTYFLGKNIDGFTCGFNEFSPKEEIIESQEKAISYAAYRLIRHRFFFAPGAFKIYESTDSLMNLLGYDKNFTATNYENGSSAALGNYIAECIINYGLSDGSNEEGEYSNEYYIPSNEPLLADSPGNPGLVNPNRWQPLTLETFIDQSGNEIPGSTPDFLSPEWGIVKPFSLKEEDATIYQRDGFDYWVYHDPGPPPFIDPVNDPEGTALYQWNFSMVAVWSGHLDANLEKEIDISPASFGNVDITTLPTDFANYDTFYDYLNGGDAGTGREENPITGMPYEPQVVKLGDYGRILAEFWADGPNSETPPGHWFTILNYVSDNIAEKRFNGQGEILDDLEWDIKSYFLFGGTMHDVAITSWGIKGYYDYVRPISAIRYMADQGQSSDDQLPSYDPAGIPLVDGFIELVEMGDPLAGAENENVGKIKLFAWKGPDYISDPDSDVAGVDWILAENWWPYQRPTFVTPNFAGYVSGHSTFSRAAAEVMTLLTGSPYFPGGLGEFEAPMNEFLVFEDGPSEDITLQWATYRDASDQTSLSRIWGGIHPPADDIPGRIIGERIGVESFLFGSSYFNANPLSVNREQLAGLVYPNPTSDLLKISLPNGGDYQMALYDFSGKKVLDKLTKSGYSEIDISEIEPGNYVLQVRGLKWESSHYVVKK